MKLQGKRALVSGADSGIGRATAELLAREGADLALTYHTDADGIRETARAVEAAGRKAVVIQEDVGDPASVRETFATVARDMIAKPRPVAATPLIASGLPRFSSRHHCWSGSTIASVPMR